MMKNLAAVLVSAWVCGCTTTPGPDYDVTTPSPGSDPSGGGATTAQITGRVCVLADAQLTSACEITGGGGLTVNFGQNTATTAADGSFTIPTTGVANGTPISVSGAGITSSQVRATGSPVIPVMSNDLYNNMVLATGITTEPDTGVILASLESQQNAPLVGTTVTTNPAAASGVFYDNAQGTSPWSTNATGARGIVMVPNVPSGATTSMTFTNSSGGETTVDGIQVVTGGVTFTDAQLP